MQRVFWQELIKELRESGSRHVTGIAGQLSSFAKIRPGYYGELGSIIIHRVLYAMFPTKLDVAELDLSLDVKDFGDRRRALRVMRDSGNYGVSMFPVDSEEGGAPAEMEEESDMDEDGGDHAGSLGQERSQRGCQRVGGSGGKPNN
ncbi:hypothetical protein B0H13DRAFT_2301232 [Mycena leptocephala]|nr:hypothetical protein B0H13DRAFT_2301232 [Mycena leptocephala]